MTSSGIPVIHAVTTDEIVRRSDFLDQARSVMKALGPRGAVQLRAHRITGRALYDIAAVLAGWQEETGCWLIANDRVDVALAAGARGVQLTSKSMHVADATRIAPEIAVGASVHSVSESRQAALAGARWCVAGNVFPPQSHPESSGRGTGFVRALVAAARIPIIAIGGVLPSHLARLLAAGAHGVATIRGIWSVSDADRAARDYLSAHDAAAGEHGPTDEGRPGDVE